MSRIILLGLLLAIALPAQADQPCSTPMANWQPVAALVAEAEKLGWTVQKIRADDGCYHVKATDKTGTPVEAEFDPQTLKLLGRSDDDHEGKGDHDAPIPGSSN